MQSAKATAEVTLFLRLWRSHPASASSKAHSHSQLHLSYLSLGQGAWHHQQEICCHSQAQRGGLASLRCILRGVVHGVHVVVWKSLSSPHHDSLSRGSTSALRGVLSCLQGTGHGTGFGCWDTSSELTGLAGSYSQLTVLFPSSFPASLEMNESSRWTEEEMETAKKGDTLIFFILSAVLELTQQLEIESI